MPYIEHVGSHNVERRRRERGGDREGAARHPRAGAWISGPAARSATADASPSSAAAKFGPECLDSGCDWASQDSDVADAKRLPRGHADGLASGAARSAAVGAAALDVHLSSVSLGIVFADDSAARRGRHTVRNHLDEIAEAGGMEHYTGPLPAGFTLTAPYTIPCSWSRAERWYYVLNCSACGRKGVTAAGIGKSPETWARDKGWKPPNSGSAKWTRIVCPSCTGV